MGTCNNQQRSNNNRKARGCTRKLGDMTKEGVLELEQQQQQQQQHRQQQQGSPPAKKRRPLPLDTANTTTNAETQRSPNVNNVTIAELNQQAMNLYQRGEFGTASTLFREAVTLRMKESTGARECLADVCNPINSSIQQQPQQNIPPRHSYIYQRTEFDEGMNVYAETLPIQPDGHSDEVQATLLFNAGQARRKLNDLEGASQLYDRALETFLAPGKSIAIIQTEYPIIIPLLHNIGQLTYCNGNLEEAIQIYEVALRHAKKIHSEDDISVGLTLNCLGVLCYHLSTDRSDLARTYFEQALTILNRVLGHDSFASATTYNNLGRVHVQREEFTEALENYEKSLKIRERLGTEHIDYAASAFNAGQGYHQLGQFDRALKLYQRFLNIALKKFTRKHRDVAVVLSGIAQIYQEKKDYKKALELYNESLVVGRAALGNTHSEVAMLLNRLGNFHFDRGNFDDAIVVYNEGLHIERKVLPKNHPNVIVTLSNVAEIYRQRNDYPKAIKIYNEALVLQRKCYGVSSIEVAASLNVLGLIYDLQGNSSVALKCLQEALVIRRTVLGDNHLDLSATLIYLGTIFYRRGATSMALQLFTESLRIRIDNHGRNHRDVSFTLYNCALCLQQQGCYKEAIEYYQETQRIERMVLGESHKDIAMTFFKLGECLILNGEPDSALEKFQSSLEIERGLQEDSDPATVARILNEIGNIYLAKGKTDKVMEHLIEAARILQKAGLSPLESLSLPDRSYAFGISCPASAAAA